MPTTPAVLPPNPFGNNYAVPQGGGISQTGGATSVHPSASLRFKLTWNGGRVLDQIGADQDGALQSLTTEAVAVARGLVHVKTGDMRDKCFAEVRVDPVGRRRTLAIGSSSTHAIFEELGTRFRAGHPQLRAAMDVMKPRVTDVLNQLTTH